MSLEIRNNRGKNFVVFRFLTVSYHLLEDLAEYLVYLPITEALSPDPMIGGTQIIMFTKTIHLKHEGTAHVQEGYFKLVYEATLTWTTALLFRNKVHKYQSCFTP